MKTALKLASSANEAVILRCVSDKSDTPPDGTENKKLDESAPSGNSKLDSLILFAELTLALVAFSVITWIGLVYTGESKNAESIFDVLTPNNISNLVLINLLLGLLLYAVRFPFAWLERNLESVVDSKFNQSEQQNGTNNIVSKRSSEALKGLVDLFISLTQLAAYLLLVMLYIPFACRFYPKAKPIGNATIEYLLDPLTALASSLLHSLPDFFAIAIYLIIASYVLRFLHLFAEAVNEKQIKLTWLQADSVMSIYQVLRIFILIFTFVAIFRRLPGSDHAEFTFVAGFMALIATLSSSSAVGNFIAGLVMTFMRPFQKGDRVKIGNVEGDVLDYTLLVTRIVTPKNERVSVPNLKVLSGEIYNYSSYASVRGVGISATVTIGYDVPHSQVQSMLLEAAANTKDVVEQPEPFVLQNSLGDFSISYEIVCFTKRARQMPRIRSDLQAQILSTFAAKGVEILSPAYHAIRDGNTPTVPSKINGRETKEVENS